MGSCTERLRPAPLLLGALAALLSQACATGALLEAGRRTETVLAFQEAYTDGHRAWLVYETETRDRRGVRLFRRTRAATFELADLDPARGRPLDAFPLRRTDASEIPVGESQPIPLWLEGRERPTAAQGERRLRVNAEGGRHAGFSPLHFEGLPPDAHFHSGALIERHTAVWAYPLVPFAVAFDAVTTPVVAFFATPFFVVGD
jgi:hypothetical protein